MNPCDFLSICSSVHFPGDRSHRSPAAPWASPCWPTLTRAWEELAEEISDSDQAWEVAVGDVVAAGDAVAVVDQEFVLRF